MNRSTTLFSVTWYMLIVCKNNIFISTTNMIFILFERQIIVVYVAFYLTKIHSVVPKLQCFCYNPCKYFRISEEIFSGQVSGVKKFKNF